MMSSIKLGSMSTWALLEMVLASGSPPSWTATRMRDEMVGWRIDPAACRTDWLGRRSFRAVGRGAMAQAEIESPKGFVPEDR